ncbi:MAG TPA: stimulus-sensing domain-containing protein [Ferrovibrio sp.]|uniref:stimulus-sensing domain-containing protein n=1 Tax=Ferrovibrio sp. TaxID=1917215 RepID=UPI002ED69A1A
MSPLTRRILLINLAAPISLILAFLYLDQFRLGLIESRLTSLRYEANLMAGALGESAISPEEFTPTLDPEMARQLLRRLAAQSSARARLYGTDGQLIADSRLLLAAGRGVITRQLPPPEIDTPWERALVHVYERINAQFMTHLDLPKYVELPFTHANDYIEARKALAGDAYSQLRDLGGGRIMLSTAVPVQGLRKVVGALMLNVDSTEIDTRVREERLSVLKVFAAVLGFTVLASLYLAGAIVRPVHRLAEAAERIRTAKGRIAHLHIPDFSGRNDEIGDLSAVLRAMTTALTQRLDSIERFAADVAHEIKNPLTSLRSAMETFARTEKPELRERLLTVMQDDVRRIDRLVTDISAASRLDSELARTEAAPVDIAAMLRSVVDTYAVRAEASGGPKVELRLIEPGPYLAHGFESRLGQVARNLIDNAISFSPPGGTITVAVRREPRHVMFSVSDEGPGIPEENLESIFDRFYSDRPSEEAFGLHSGLGLSIARQIVQSLGGRIYAENRDDGTSGARFTVRLPL